MNKALAELIQISNRTGTDPTLVQGGGGNTSVKTADGKYMYIKASGTALKDMNQQQGWRRMRLEPVLAVLKDKSLPKLDASICCLMPAMITLKQLPVPLWKPTCMRA